MGTEILRPQDCLIERFPPIHRRRNGGGGGGPFCPRRRQASARPEKKRHGGAGVDLNWKPSNEISINQVTILRRGESMDSLNSHFRRFEPPEIRVGRCSGDVYAGAAAFSNSPSPRSLPLPSFFKKQQDGFKTTSFDDSATRDLRRLLRLE